MSSSKKILLGVLAVVAIVTLFNHRYQFLPAKKVAVGEPVTIHKWQTLKFGNGKKVTFCDVSGNGLTTDFHPHFSWYVKGELFPCSRDWRSFYYVIEHNRIEGPYRPYGIEQIAYPYGSKNSALVRITDTAVEYPLFSDSMNEFSCRTNDNDPTFDQEGCILSHAVENGDPGFCSRQTAISADECLKTYITKFKNQCAVRPETHNENDSWTMGIDNQDDCLKSAIVERHLPSVNCSLLVEDEAKKNSCLETRETEEKHFEMLRQ